MVSIASGEVGKSVGVLVDGNGVFLRGGGSARRGGLLVLPGVWEEAEIGDFSLSESMLEMFSVLT